MYINNGTIHYNNKKTVTIKRKKRKKKCEYNNITKLFVKNK